jgi:hypothetical protein
MNSLMVKPLLRLLADLDRVSNPGESQIRFSMIEGGSDASSDRHPLILTLV